MEATGVSHIAVCVRDMEKSLGFYRDILGMKVIKDQIEDTTSGGLPHTYKQARKTRRTVHIAYGASQEPVLVMTSHPGEQPEGEPIKLDQVGISHLSFTVKDINGLATELVSKGVEIAGGVQAFADVQGNIRTFFAYDPDGILVQFDAGIEG